MKCAYCPNQVTGSYVCETCMADIQSRFAAAEAKARTVSCPECPSGIGVACRTGSGVKRGIAHASRKKIAERTAR